MKHAYLMLYIYLLANVLPILMNRKPQYLGMPEESFLIKNQYSRSVIVVLYFAITLTTFIMATYACLDNPG